MNEVLTAGSAGTSLHSPCRVRASESSGRSGSAESRVAGSTQTGRSFVRRLALVLVFATLAFALARAEAPHLLAYSQEIPGSRSRCDGAGAVPRRRAGVLDRPPRGDRRPSSTPFWPPRRRWASRLGGSRRRRSRASPTSRSRPAATRPRRRGPGDAGRGRRLRGVGPGRRAGPTGCRPRAEWEQACRAGEDDASRSSAGLVCGECRRAPASARHPGGRPAGARGHARQPARVDSGWSGPHGRYGGCAQGWVLVRCGRGAGLLRAPSAGRRDGGLPAGPALRGSLALIPPVLATRRLPRRPRHRRRG